ncbi:hypothetical protein FDECE_15501 [Fusarium decemcellulare]|nr:hypothetical protein FDECE_15501 [Fusarium decemcellulare]
MSRSMSAVDRTGSWRKKDSWCAGAERASDPATKDLDYWLQRHEGHSHGKGAVAGQGKTVQKGGLQSTLFPVRASDYQHLTAPPPFMQNQPTILEQQCEEALQQREAELQLVAQKLDEMKLQLENTEQQRALYEAEKQMREDEQRQADEINRQEAKRQAMVAEKEAKLEADRKHLYMLELTSLRLPSSHELQHPPKPTSFEREPTLPVPTVIDDVFPPSPPATKRVTRSYDAITPTELVLQVQSGLRSGPSSPAPVTGLGPQPVAISDIMDIMDSHRACRALLVES